jgi:hypothetical protein
MILSQSRFSGLLLLWEEEEFYYCIKDANASKQEPGGQLCIFVFHVVAPKISKSALRILNRELFKMIDQISMWNSIMFK